MDISKNYYEILGVPTYASAEEIKAAYKKLAMKYHPDRNQGSKFHEEHFKLILEAYQTLSDKYNRDIYDLRRTYKYQPSASSTSSNPNVRRPSGYRPPTANRKSYKPPPTPPESSFSTFFGHYKKYLSPHLIAAYLTVVALIVTSIFWIVGVVARDNAEKAFRKGDFMAALQHDPTYYPALVKRAEVLRTVWKNPIGAIEDYDLAIKYAKTPQAEMFRYRGECYLMLNNYKEAIKDFKVVAEMQPNSDSAHYWVGEIQLFKLNDTQSAKIYFRKCLELSPNFNKASFGIGYAFLLEGNYKSGLAQLNALIDKGYDTGEVRYYTGVAYYKLGEKSAAEKEWLIAKEKGFVSNKAILRH